MNADVFDLGQPLSPFTQLMATLPRFSYTLLPGVLQAFMEDPESPLAEYYPDEARIDMEGKRAEWEAIVLLPGKLLKTMDALSSYLF